MNEGIIVIAIGIIVSQTKINTIKIGWLLIGLGIIILLIRLLIA